MLKMILFLNLVLTFQLNVNSQNAELRNVLEKQFTILISNNIDFIRLNNSLSFIYIKNNCGINFDNNKLKLTDTNSYKIFNESEIDTFINQKIFIVKKTDSIKKDFNYKVNKSIQNEDSFIFKDNFKHIIFINFYNYYKKGSFYFCPVLISKTLINDKMLLWFKFRKKRNSYIFEKIIY